MLGRFDIAAIVCLGVSVAGMGYSNIHEWPGPLDAVPTAPFARWDYEYDFIVEMKVDAWGFHLEALGETQFSSWYVDDNDGHDGILFLRAAGPLLQAATIAAIVAGVQLARRRQRSGAGFALAAAALLALAATALVVGFTRFLEGTGSPEWKAGFYLYIACFSLLAVGGALAWRASLPATAPASVPSAPAPPPSVGADSRDGRCPRCETPMTIFRGTTTPCPKCGFGV